jgi:hypothetical protein
MLTINLYSVLDKWTQSYMSGPAKSAVIQAGRYASNARTGSE